MNISFSYRDDDSDSKTGHVGPEKLVIAPSLFQLHSVARLKRQKKELGERKDTKLNNAEHMCKAAARLPDSRVTVIHADTGAHVCVAYI